MLSRKSISDCLSWSFSLGFHKHNYFWSRFDYWMYGFLNVLREDVVSSVTTKYPEICPVLNSSQKSTQYLLLCALKRLQLCVGECICLCTPAQNSSMWHKRISVNAHLGNIILASYALQCAFGGSLFLLFAARVSIRIAVLHTKSLVALTVCMAMSLCVKLIFFHPILEFF